MATENPDGGNAQRRARRNRGPAKSYPVVPFESTVRLAKGIDEYGIAGEIQRLTLLSKLSMSPTSSATRNLIVGGKRYGLTHGSYGASLLSLTDEGEAFLKADDSDEAKGRAFRLAISRVEPFAKLYEKIREKRLPDASVLQDEFQRTGLTADDASKAVEVFAANLQYLGLIEKIGASDHVRDVGTTVTQEPELEPIISPGGGPAFKSPAPPPPVASVEPTVAVSTQEPSLHIDIQIHIDSSATAGQIDQIFESMGKHLYGRS